MMANPPPLVNVAVAYAAFKWGGINLFNDAAAPKQQVERVDVFGGGGVSPFHRRAFWGVWEITERKERGKKRLSHLLAFYLYSTMYVKVIS